MLILPDNINARVITADPPIPFKTWSRKGEGRSPQHHYKCPEFDKLAAIPVASLAAPDCFLLLWVPLRSVILVVPLMDVWGFEFSGAGFVWMKLNKKECCRRRLSDCRHRHQSDLALWRASSWEAAMAPDTTRKSAGSGVAANHNANRKACGN